jgi:ParB family transcriptional regulator, chromosome partitioning protein
MTVAAEKTTAAVPEADKDAINKGTGSANSTGAAKSTAAAGSGHGSGEGSTAGSAAEKSTSENRPVPAHDKRKALGRGLESLLGSMRAAVHPSSAGSVTAGNAGAAAQVSAQTTGANLGHPGASESVASAVGTTPTTGPAAAPVPGYVAEMQAMARRGPDDHEVIDLAIDRIDVNPHQTRSFTDGEIKSLEELRDSVKVHGVIQPVTVRPGKDGRYFLITGERRMRASQMAGKKTIPAIVRVVSEQQAAEMTVIENLQRRDLNCMDLARAYIMLSQDFGLTQEQIGARVGVSRESVSNYMRLSKLPDIAQSYLQNGTLSFSHARLLLNLDDPVRMAKAAVKAMDQAWSVDQLENYLFEQNWVTKPKKEGHHGARWVDPNVRAAERRLQELLGVRVKIRDRKGKGSITLEYASLEDFDRVLSVLTGQQGRS